MKNKKMIILAASLVMSLTISGAVTNLVKGREGENNKALWVQVAEDTLETMGKADVASVSDPAMMPEEEVETAKTSVESPETVASNKASGAVPDSRSADPEKQVTDTAVQETSDTPVEAGQAAPEAMLTEEEIPQTPAASTPRASVEEEPDALGPETETNPEASATAVEPAPTTKPQATAPGGILQVALAEEVEKSTPNTPTTETEKASKETILQLTIAAENNTDPMFHQIPIDMLDQLYWNPAVKLLNSIGAKNPLTQAFLYDMMVNHGQDGAQNLINKANYALGGTPGMGVDENTYLMKLMDLRETYLDNTGNPGADRVAAFRRILTEGNINLATPFDFTVYGDTFRIDGDME